MIQQDEVIRQILSCICHPLPTADLRLLQCRSLTKGVVMIENMHWSQAQLARYWQLSEGTLERWRSEGIGPIFLKLQGQVRYRIEDISAYEEECLRVSTSVRASPRNDQR